MARAMGIRSWLRHWSLFYDTNSSSHTAWDFHICRLSVSCGFCGLQLLAKASESFFSKEKHCETVALNERNFVSRSTQLVLWVCKFQMNKTNADSKGCDGIVFFMSQPEKNSKRTISLGIIQAYQPPRALTMMRMSLFILILLRRSLSRSVGMRILWKQRESLAISSGIVRLFYVHVTRRTACKPWNQF